MFSSVQLTLCVRTLPGQSFDSPAGLFGSRALRRTMTATGNLKTRLMFLMHCSKFIFITLARTVASLERENLLPVVLHADDGPAARLKASNPIP
jgi:hypothetical protein